MFCPRRQGVEFENGIRGSVPNVSIPLFAVTCVVVAPLQISVLLLVDKVPSLLPCVIASSVRLYLCTWVRDGFKMLRCCCFCFDNDEQSITYRSICFL